VGWADVSYRLVAELHPALIGLPLSTLNGRSWLLNAPHRADI